MIKAPAKACCADGSIGRLVSSNLAGSASPWILIRNGRSVIASTFHDVALHAYRAHGWKLRPSRIGLMEILADCRPWLGLGLAPTVWEDVYRLPAASHLRSGFGEMYELHRSFEGSEVTALRSRKRLAEIIRATVLKCFEDRRKVAVLLSGGIDSSIVATCAIAAMTRDKRRGVHLLTSGIGFGEGNQDSAYAQAVADNLNVPLIHLSEGDAANKPEWFVPRCQPHVSWFPRQEVEARDFAMSLGCDALIDGDGGDLLFGGYQSIDEWRMKRSGVWKVLDKVLHHESLSNHMEDLRRFLREFADLPEGVRLRLLTLWASGQSRMDRDALEELDGNRSISRISPLLDDDLITSALGMTVARMRGLGSPQKGLLRYTARRYRLAPDVAIYRREASDHSGLILRGLAHENFRVGKGKGLCIDFPEPRRLLSLGVLSEEGLDGYFGQMAGDSGVLLPGLWPDVWRMIWRIRVSEEWLKRVMSEEWSED